MTLEPKPMTEQLSPLLQSGLSYRAIAMMLGLGLRTSAGPSQARSKTGKARAEGHGGVSPTGGEQSGNLLVIRPILALEQRLFTRLDDPQLVRRESTARLSSTTSLRYQFDDVVDLVPLLVGRLEASQHNSEYALPHLDDSAQIECRFVGVPPYVDAMRLILHVPILTQDQWSL